LLKNLSVGLMPAKHSARTKGGRSAKFALRQREAPFLPKTATEYFHQKQLLRRESNPARADARRARRTSSGSIRLIVGPATIDTDEGRIPVHSGETNCVRSSRASIRSFDGAACSPRTAREKPLRVRLDKGLRRPTGADRPRTVQVDENRGGRGRPLTRPAGQPQRSDQREGGGRGAVPPRTLTKSGGTGGGR